MIVPFRILLIIGMLTVANEVMAQKVKVPAINQQEKHLLNSTSNGKTYPLFVSLPKHYDASDSIRYPILLLLDGSFSFPIAHATRTLLDMFGEIEDVIIVGIGDEWERSYEPWMTNRWEDYTPSSDPKSDTNPAYLQYFDLPAGSLVSGGGAVFLDVIRTEIIPFIDSHYHTGGDRGISGHSFGGLFAANCLLTVSNLFSRFGILSPSFWWNSDEIFDLEKSFSTKNSTLEAKVFMSVGSLEGQSMVPKMLAFSDSLHSRNYQGLNLTTHIFEDETHNSVVAASISRTIRVLYGKQP
jgi:predicted alpha/beta superfamily hydrolase